MTDCCRSSVVTSCTWDTFCVTAELGASVVVVVVVFCDMLLQVGDRVGDVNWGCDRCVDVVSDVRWIF